jgi:hypothetical protein
VHGTGVVNGHDGSIFAEMDVVGEIRDEGADGN